jgi:hypothetical protein
MKLRWIIALALLPLSGALHAERLEFDHRLYPPLRETLDSGDRAMIEFDSRNPQRLVDLIAIKGKSAHNWTEALEIVSIVRPADVAGARDWMELIKRQATARCPAATFATIAEDANSVTFERRSPGCGAERASYGLYRLVAGKRSWFQLAVLVKGEVDPAAHDQWLALLASAHLG